MRLTTLVVALSACASTARDRAPASAMAVSGASAPAPPPPALEPFIGDYYAQRDTVYVRESGGALEAVVEHAPLRLRHINGDTFATRGARMLLLPNRLEYGGAHYDKRIRAAGTFRITPLHPVAELRQAALAATPPTQPDTLRKPDLVELKELDGSIKYDIRYATDNNFMGAVFYSSAHAFMQRPAAEAVARAHGRLKAMGYGLLIHDAYRPWYVTRMFWDATPDSLRAFVADPRSGSRHNRGAAVDLTLYDLQTGQPVEMPGGYDEFSERSYPNYPGGTERQRWHRDLLRRVMEAEGFQVYDVEWWHFDFKDWRRYPIGNRTFEQLAR